MRGGMGGRDERRDGRGDGEGREGGINSEL